MAVLAALATALAGCGQDEEAAATHTAAAFVHDLIVGDDAGACGLETAASAYLQGKVGSLMGRYSARSPGVCDLQILLPESLFAGISEVPRAAKTVVRGDHATVSFPADKLPVLPALTLVKVSGAWQVDITSQFDGLQTAQGVANFDSHFFSPACLNAWNSAVETGEVTIPVVLGASQSTWAELVGTNSGGVPCSDILINAPSARYCESFVQSQSSSSWLPVTCQGPSSRSTLERDVWLKSDGTAIPASMASPDGTVPSLAQSASFVPPSSVSKPTDTNGAGTTTPTIAPAPANPGTRCGTVIGGTYDFQGQTLTVYAGPGVSCGTAMRVMTDLSAGNAQNHEGPDEASSYYALDGWACDYGQMGTQNCSTGKLQITAFAPGAQP